MFDQISSHLCLILGYPLYTWNQTGSVTRTGSLVSLLQIEATSAYGPQMEQQYSTRNVSDSSETGSDYELESGFYMKSFTAIIFIASLVTAGVLLLTLLISLTIMLQSCQNKNTGVIELQNINDYYSYCKVYSLHVELNHIEGYYLPNICRDLAIHYVGKGQYARDLELTMSVIDDYFSRVKHSDEGIDVVLMDIDGIFLPDSNPSNLFNRFDNDIISKCIKEAKSVKLKLFLRLYLNLQTNGWSIVLLSREPETIRNVTINRLASAGFRGWSSLIMRPKDEVFTKGNGYFYRQRNVVQRKGFRVKGIISTHMDALIFSDTGMRNFLLPDTVCDLFQQDTMNTVH